MPLSSSILVASVTSPPAADTVRSGPTKLGAKTITSPAPQAPPRTSWFEPVSATIRGWPPKSSVTLRRFCAKKPILRLSGDQNGYRASWVPGSIVASRSARARIQSAARPSSPRATKASRCPSGERAMPLTRLVPGGASIWNSAWRAGVLSLPPCYAEPLRYEPAEEKPRSQNARAQEPDSTATPGRHDRPGRRFPRFPPAPRRS